MPCAQDAHATHHAEKPIQSPVKSEPMLTQLEGYTAIPCLDVVLADLTKAMLVRIVLVNLGCVAEVSSSGFRVWGF